MCTTTVFLIIPIIYTTYIVIRNNKVAQFRNKIRRKLYKSMYWVGLSKEFNRVSHKQMVFSFKKLRVESFFSRNFVNKYYRG